ncbi:DNA polymerase IV [Fimbriiglobus ruber]|uniref:DNA polymerase IV n=2 Tax=Fimbriiglobus ruber TaxID=1908690 RepID=A0A225D7D0_9BACT|nr:DNA polymerase IV [Fimbriiglobus ruber]
MPIWEAKQACPDGIYIKRDFRWYEAISKRMLAELREHFSPRVENYSIDESFWAGYPCPGMDFQASAVHIRDHMLRVVGVPVTVAFARTRTLAKLFADTSKPFGAVAVLDQDRERELLAKLPVTEIAGIGARRAARLEPYGLKTCLDLARASRRLVRDLLTVVGQDLHDELNGIQVTPIRTQRTPHKNIARGGSLAGRVKDAFTLYGWLIRNVERLIEELHFHEVRPSTLTVYISYFEHPSAGGEVSLGVPSDRFDVIADAAKIGLGKAWRPGRQATHMHLIASKLKRAGSWQQGLFDMPDERAEALARVKREINETFGRFKIRSGATLYANDFYQDPANEYDVCDIRGKFCF